MRLIIIFSFLTIFQVSVFGQQTQTSSDTLHWNSKRLLTWEDFKGRPVQGIGFFGEALCQNAANFQKMSAFSSPKTYVHAIFDRRNSWVDPEQRSDHGLLYFQVMFNLFETHARELRKNLKATKLGFNPTKKFEELHGISMSKLADEYALFRAETKGGSDAISLAQWDEKIRQRLETFKDYPDSH